MQIVYRAYLISFNFYRKHRKLQKKVANIQFDLTLTDNCIKGCILKFLHVSSDFNSTDFSLTCDLDLRSQGALQTFEFAEVQDPHCCISNALWDSI